MGTMGIVSGVLGAMLCGAIGFAIAGWKAFFKAYYSKRGENLATKDDFNDLKEQTRQLTIATKEIEAKIDDQVWNRQRRWEMKRDAVVSAIQAMSASEDALMVACSFYQMWRKDPTNKLVTDGYQTETLKWKRKITIFESKRMIAKLICSDEFNAALAAVRLAIRGGMKQIMNKTIESYDDIGPSVSPAVHAAVMAARKELGLPKETTPQSSGSSAAPSPDSTSPAAGIRARRSSHRATPRPG